MLMFLRGWEISTAKCWGFARRSVEWENAVYVRSVWHIGPLLFIRWVV